MTGSEPMVSSRQPAEEEAGDVEKMAATHPDGQTNTDRSAADEINTVAAAAAAENLIREAPAGTANLSAPEHDPFLDGGWRAWSQVVAAHIATMLSWGYGTGFAVFQLYYKQQLGLPASQVSWVGSIQLFLCFVVGLASGRLADAGHLRACYVAGTALTCLGIFMTSLAATVPGGGDTVSQAQAATIYWRLILAQSICTGLGGGLAFVPAIANVGAYFRRRRVLAMSVNACGSSTGAILFPAIVQYLTPRLGFPWAVRVVGFVALFLSVIGNLLLRPRRTPGVQTRKSGPIIDWQAFHDIPFVVFTAGSFLVYFSVFTLLIYVNSFARDRIGLSDTESVNFIFITNAFAVVARPIFGQIADRYLGPINTYGLNGLALAIMAFAWAGVRSRTEMYVYSCVMGFVNGAAQGVFPGASSSLVSDPSRLGSWVGMIFTVCGLATLAGPPVMGAIIDASGGTYLWAQIWAGLVIILGAVCTLAAARMVGMRRAAKGGDARHGFFLKA